eukprot:scaffold4510_cov183-Amphora_coffeaeformis.AAC.19
MMMLLERRRQPRVGKRNFHGNGGNESMIRHHGRSHGTGSRCSGCCCSFASQTVNLLKLHRLGINLEIFFHRVHGHFLALTATFGRLLEFTGFHALECEYRRNVGGSQLGQLLVHPECRGTRGGRAKGTHVDKAVIVELSAKGLEVSRVEKLGENVLGKVCGRVQDEETLAPFNHASVLFGLQHVVQTFHKLVQA